MSLPEEPTSPDNGNAAALAHDADVAHQNGIIRVLFAFDAVLEPQALHGALCRVVERKGWRRFGARLRRSGLNDLELYIPPRFDADRPAVSFSTSVYPMTVRDHKHACQLLQQINATDDIQVHPANCRQFIEPDGTPRNISDYLDSDRSVLGLHVSSFHDATLVALYMPHCTADGIGISYLFKAWTLAINGREDKIPTPVETDAVPQVSNHKDEEQAEQKEEEDKEEREEQEHGMIVPLRSAVLSWTRFASPSPSKKAVSRKEFRTIAIPTIQMKTLQEKAIRGLTLGLTPKEISERLPLNDSDVLLSWWSRLALSHLPRDSQQPVCLINVIAQRPQVPGQQLVLNKTREPKALTLGASYVKNQPLGTIAYNMRKFNEENQTKDTLTKLATWQRNAGLSPPPPIAPPGTHPIALSTMVRGKLYELDFTKAAIQAPGRHERTVSPSSIHIHINGLEDFDTAWITGRDANGNYWLHCGTDEENWRKIEHRIATGQHLQDEDWMRSTFPPRSRL